MTEIVHVDKSGRIVIPKNLRKIMGIKENTKFILTKRGEGQLLLLKLDIDQISKRLEKELAGKDLDAIVESVRKELNERIRVRYPDLLA